MLYYMDLIMITFFHAIHRKLVILNDIRKAENN
jgi:hypothetical protein